MTITLPCSKQFYLDLQRAMEIAQEKHPEAHSLRHAAFARSVVALVHECSEADHAPSVREHAAIRVFGEGKPYKFDKIVEELIKENGVIFGPLKPIHLECYAEEHCFNDDPADREQLKHLGSI